MGKAVIVQTRCDAEISSCSKEAGGQVSRMFECREGFGAEGGYNKGARIMNLVVSYGQLAFHCRQRMQSGASAC